MFHGRRWTIFYASGLSLVCAMLLASLNQVLLPRIDLNRENERNEVILGCFGVTLPEGATGADIKRLYEERVAENTLTLDDGTEVRYYTMTDESGALDAIAVQVEGVGLWSFIHGYVAIEAADLATIRQVNFDKQEETPGLGGEIVSDWFRAQFKGKSILRDGKPIARIIAKPGQAQAYQVDGISGATITSTAVNRMLYRGFVQATRIAEQLRTEGADA